jgi:hypothetical protein
MLDRSFAPCIQWVLDALTGEFTSPIAIAERAGLQTRSRIEEAVRLCNYLVKLGLAEWQEGRWRRWRRVGTVA